MTKARPNDPCPCGSGRKYKRCCGDPSKAGARPDGSSAGAQGDAPEAAPLVPSKLAAPSARTPEPYSWPPLDTSRIPPRLLRPNEARRLLPLPHRRVVAHLAELVDMQSEASAREGLQLLDMIPDDDIQAVWPLVEFRLTLLADAGERDKYWTETLRYMTARRDERSWMRMGAVLTAQPPLCEDQGVRIRTIDGLRAAVGACNNVAPRLLLGVVLALDSRDGLPDEALNVMHHALLDRAWDAHRLEFGPWRNAVGYAFGVVIEELVRRGRDEEALIVAQRAGTFNWNGAPGMVEATLDQLLRAMFRAKAHDVLIRVGRELLRARSDQPSVHFWLGRAALARGDMDRTLRHLRQGIHTPDLSDEEAVAVASLFVHGKDWQAALDVLDRVKERQATLVMYFQARALVGMGQTERACELAARVWELAPSERSAFSVRLNTLKALGRDDELASWYREILSTPDSPFELDARLGLVRLELRADREQQALELVAGWVQSVPSVSDAGTLAQVRCTIGDVLTANGRHAEAAVHYERAARIEPGPSHSARLAHALLASGRQDEAETELSVALQVWPDDTDLLIAGVMTADARGAFGPSLERLERLGDPWELEPGLREPIVVAKVRALGELDRPMEALECFEGHLDAVLGDDGLRRLREAVLQEAKTRFGQLERALEREQRRLRAHHDATRRVVAELRRGADRKRAEIDRLVRKREEATWREASEQMSWEGPQLPSGLAQQHRALIEGAERAWNALAARPDDDHGAVVMQLARVVEALVNQQLVDRMAALCVERHASLQVLQAVTSGRVATRDNRLSLGEAVSALYADHERREGDGSVSLVRNPRSTEEHRQLADELWSRLLAGAPTEQDGLYLRHQLPVALLALAKIRNQAGHADNPLPRAAASQARVLVLGDGERRGILHRLSQRLDGSAGG